MSPWPHENWVHTADHREAWIAAATCRLESQSSAPRSSPPAQVSRPPSAPQVAAAPAGAIYRGVASVRSSVSGRPLCVRVRESASSEVGNKTVCVTAGSSWQQIVVDGYAVKRAGTKIDIYVYEWKARR